MSDPKRWSGFHTQSEAWQAGYEWANGRGPYCDLGLDEALDTSGYIFTPQEREWDKGVRFAEIEHES